MGTTVEGRSVNDAATDAVLALMGGMLQRESNHVADWPADERDLHRNGDHRSFTERAEAVSRLRAQKIVEAVRVALEGDTDAEADTVTEVPPGRDTAITPFDRCSVDDALRMWEESGPTSLTVASMADALYRVREALDVSTAVEVCARGDVHTSGVGEHDAHRWGPCSVHKRNAHETLKVLAELLGATASVAPDADDIV